MVTLYDRQTKTSAELTWLRAQNANGVAKKTKLKFVLTKSERLSKRAEVVRRFGSRLSVPLTDVCSALRAERDVFKNRYKAAMLVNRCILGLAK